MKQYTVAILGATGAVGTQMLECLNEQEFPVGKLKLLAASTPVRLTPLPEVPTLREQGWDEAVEMYIVLVGPKNLPADVRERLNAAVAALDRKSVV